LIKPNGLVYTGDWKLGKANGDGELRLNESAVITGNFLDDKPEDNCTIVLKNGTEISG